MSGEATMEVQRDWLWLPEVEQSNPVERLLAEISGKLDRLLQKRDKRVRSASGELAEHQEARDLSMRVLNHIDRSGTSGVKRWPLMRAIRLRKTELDLILSDLLAEQHIVAVHFGRTRRGTIYFSARVAEKAAERALGWDA